MSIPLFHFFRLSNYLRSSLAATPKPTLNAACSRLAAIRLGPQASLQCAGALLFAMGAHCPVAAGQIAHFSGARSKAVDGAQVPSANRDASVADSDMSQVHSNQAPAPANFGSVNIGATSAPMTLTFTFDAATALGKTAVLTQGSPNLDFADAGTGTCKTGKSYSSGDTCTVDAILTPKHAGTRYGAAVLNDSSGKLIATGYIQGMGSGPEVYFLPGAQSTIFESIRGSGDTTEQVAVDGAGNVYFTQIAFGVLKATPSANGYDVGLLISGLDLTGGIALDSNGNIYLTDWVNDRVVKETLSAGAYTQSTVASGLDRPSGVAVDGDGNVYVIQYYTYGVLKETPSGGGYTQSTIVDEVLQYPRGIAVDGSGNVFVADTGNDRVLELTPSAGSYTQSTVGSGMYQPGAVAVDGAGNVYIADSGNARVLKETLSEGSYIQSTVPYRGLSEPEGNGVVEFEGIAVDSSGSIYIANSDSGAIDVEDFWNPPSQSFAPTLVGLTSTDSPWTVTVENVGNAPLTFPVPSTGNNPSIAANFTLDSSVPSACPLVSADSSTPGTLAAGGSCLLSISFTPEALGDFSGSPLVLTDNDQSAIAPAYATQSILLGGSGVVASQVFVSWGTTGYDYGRPGSGGECATAEDSGGAKLPGVVVSFSGVGLTFTPSSAVSDEYGMACAQITNTSGVGYFTGYASAAGVSTPATFFVQVHPAPLTVALRGEVSRVYGAANPNLFFRVNGLVNGDTIGGTILVTAQNTATTASPVGVYPFTSPTVSGTSAGYYAITITGRETLGISHAVLRVWANDIWIYYGETPPAPTNYFFTGFVNGDTASVISGAPTLSDTVTSTTPPGVYKIYTAVGTLSAQNYKFEMMTGEIKVYKAPLLVTANNVTMTQGNPVPTLTYTLTGFVNGDTASVVSGAPVLSTTATSSSPPGTYPITVSAGTLSAANYGAVINYNGGVVTVLP